MNLSFQIQPIRIPDTANADLYVQADEQGLTYLILENGICRALVIYHFNAGALDDTAADNIHQIMEEQPVLRQKFNRVHIIYGYAPCIQAPNRLMNAGDAGAMLELVYGAATERVVMTDFVQGHALHNVYGVPAVIEMVISRYFVLAATTHLFSLLPNMANIPANYLYCIFNTGRLKVILLKQGKLMAMQNFLYKTPADVAYHLLSLCKAFDVNLQGTVVRLSGMVDANSALYDELHKYFLQLGFDTLPGQYQYPEEIYQYPAHYFSHLFTVAACV